MSAEDRLREMMKAAHTEARATEADWDGFVRRAHRPLFVRRAAVGGLGAAALVAAGAFAAVALTSDDPARTPLPPASSPTASSPTVAPEPSDTPSTVAPATVEVPDFDVEEWYVAEERLSRGWTITGGEIPRELAADDPVSERAAAALRNLLGVIPGPVAEIGETSAIPDAAELLYVERDGSVLNVDLSSEFESGGGSLSMQLRVGQVVYGGTQFEGIDAVRILIEGERVDAIGGEGIVASEPLTRRDFQDVAPSIVVESPRIGSEVASGSTVEGFANVFEANVNIRVRNDKDKIIFETFTTATCGTGCWGDFSEELRFEIDHEMPGRVEVLTFSAEDGSEQDVVSTPVTLVP